MDNNLHFLVKALMGNQAQSPYGFMPNPSSMSMQPAFEQVNPRSAIQASGHMPKNDPSSFPILGRNSNPLNASAPGDLGDAGR
jgi:hypothetical protein